MYNLEKYNKNKTRNYSKNSLIIFKQTNKDSVYFENSLQVMKISQNDQKLQIHFFFLERVVLPLDQI